MNLIANNYYQEDLSTVANLDFIPWDKLGNKSILITGATGLICSFLIDVLMFRNEHFENNISIYALSRNLDYAKDRFDAYWNNPRFNYIQQDIIEGITLDKPIDFIIHGATNAFPAAYAEDPVGTMKANLWGVDNLLQYAIKTKVQRVLYISSGEVYGEGNGEDFVESYSGYVDCLNPRSCYTSAKRAAETLCVSYLDQYNVDTVIARPCHIYGANFTETDNRAFAQFLRNVLDKKDVVLKSKGTQYRSYCYVADCIPALLTILLKGNSGDAYNIANKDSNVSIAQLAEIIATIGKQTVVYDIPSDLEKKGYSVITRAVLNSDKLESLGWKSEYSLTDSIQRIVQMLSRK
jgi:nucleoside-diphosphate-sugar epimerase